MHVFILAHHIISTFLTHSLHVGHIFNTSREDLKTFFSRWGSIKDAWVARQPPGFGYVTFHKEEDAARALKEAQTLDINGELFTLAYARGRVCVFIL